MESPDTSPEGRTFRPHTPEELHSVIEDAFKYRGDVTLHLRSRDMVTGYVFGRSTTCSGPRLALFIAGEINPRSILYSDIVAVEFSGEDTASGKDWESWTHKKRSEREAEAKRLEADARARGLL